MQRGVLSRVAVLVALALISMSSFLFLSCSQRSEEKPSPGDKRTKTVEETESKQVAGKREVFMMGRSVMGGWFEHWGSDPFQRGDFAFYYKELDTPPDIVESVERCLDEVEDDNTIVFFKLCFDDFEGSSRSEAKASLSDNQKYIRQVYDLVVEERGLKLIIGNALPKVKVYSDSHLIWHQRSYNEWLKKFAQEHPEAIYVFDQYSVLSDSQGNLKQEYALSREDSHLNDKAYSALDNDFFNLLDQNF